MYDLRRNKILERLDEEALRRITAGGVLNDTLAFNRIMVQARVRPSTSCRSV